MNVFATLPPGHRHTEGGTKKYSFFLLAHSGGRHFQRVHDLAQVNSEYLICAHFSPQCAWAENVAAQIWLTASLNWAFEQGSKHVSRDLQAEQVRNGGVGVAAARGSHGPAGPLTIAGSRQSAFEGMCFHCNLSCPPASREKALYVTQRVVRPTGPIFGLFESSRGGPHRRSTCG